MTQIQECNHSSEDNIIKFPYGEIRNPLVDPKPDAKDGEVIDIDKVRELENDNRRL
jgi:hypothetical protein